MAYAAEEVGLRGSRAIAREYDLAGKNVVAAMQLDMTGFSGFPQDLYFVTDYVSTDLTSFVRGSSASTTDLVLTRLLSATRPAATRARIMPHYAAWTEVGVPAVHPFETRVGEHNAALHTADDHLGRIDSTGRKQALAKLGIEFTMEVSNAGQAHDELACR